MHENHRDQVPKWSSESSIFSSAASSLSRPLLSVEQVGALTVGEKLQQFHYSFLSFIGIFTAARFHGLNWEPRLSRASKFWKK